MKLRKPILLLTLALVLLLTACVPKTKNPIPTPQQGSNTPPTAKTSNPAADRGDTLIVASDNFQGRFNPILENSSADHSITNLIFNSLLRNDRLGHPSPSLAQKWELSEDGRTCTFYLQKGVSFHDGVGFTAEDVKFTFETIAHPDYSGPQFNVVRNITGAQAVRDRRASHIAGIEIIDAHTIRFTLDNPRMADILSIGSVGILPKHHYSFTSYEDFLTRTQNPLGSGPFQLGKFVVNQYVSLDAYKDHWAGKPKLDQIVLQYIPKDHRASALALGDIDMAPLPTDSSIIAKATETNLVDIHNFSGDSYTYIGLNTRIPKLKDARVRQALAYGLNRQAFIDSEYGNLAKPIDTAFSPASWAYNEATLQKYEYNPQLAKQLLEEAGWIDRNNDGWVENQRGEILKLTWSAYGEPPWAMGLIEQAKKDWKSIGVQLESEILDFDGVVERVYDRQSFELYSMAWELSIDPDPSDAFSAANDRLGGYNSHGWHPKQSEELLLSAVKETNPEKRRQIYHDWGQLVNNDVPYIFISIKDDIWGVNKRVSHFNVDTFIHWTWNASKLSIEK